MIAMMRTDIMFVAYPFIPVVAGILWLIYLWAERAVKRRRR